MAKFFADIADAVEVTEFTLLAIAGNATDVMAVIRFGITSKDTGRSGAMDLHHWWRFRAGCRTGPEWPHLDPLLAAVTDDEVIDLDRIPPDILAGDLVKYLRAARDARSV